MSILSSCVKCVMTGMTPMAEGRAMPFASLVIFTASMALTIWFRCVCALTKLPIE